MAQRVSSGTDNSFFGRIGSSVADVFSVALPVWTAQQLRDQSGDQLAAPLFNQAQAGPRADLDTLETTGDARAQPASFIQFGGTSVGGLTLAIGLAGLLGVFLLLRK